MFVFFFSFNMASVRLFICLDCNGIFKVFSCLIVTKISKDTLIICS